jgi:hypothetical protein
MRRRKKKMSKSMTQVSYASWESRLSEMFQEVIQPCDLAGYTAQDAAKQLSENWAQNCSDENRAHITPTLLADVDDVISHLISWREQVRVHYTKK